MSPVQYHLPRPIDHLKLLPFPDSPCEDSAEDHPYGCEEECEHDRHTTDCGPFLIGFTISSGIPCGPAWIPALGITTHACVPPPVNRGLRVEDVVFCLSWKWRKRSPVNLNPA